MKTKRDTSLETIDRRFQFIIVLALFLPFIWDDLVKIVPSIIDQLGSNRSSYIGLLITYILLSYTFFEFGRELIKDRLLEVVKETLLLLSYTLIILIAFASAHQLEIVAGWKFYLVGFSFVFNMVLPILVLILTAYAIAVPVFRWVQNRF